MIESVRVKKIAAVLVYTFKRKEFKYKYDEKILLIYIQEIFFNAGDGNIFSSTRNNFF